MLRRLDVVPEGRSAGMEPRKRIVRRGDVLECERAVALMEGYVHGTSSRSSKSWRGREVI